MPADELLSVQAVCLNLPVEQIVSQAGLRVTCESCGEDIMNGREVVREGAVLCKSCAGPGYYSVIAESSEHIALVVRPEVV